MGRGVGRGGKEGWDEGWDEGMGGVFVGRRKGGGRGVVGSREWEGWYGGGRLRIGSFEWCGWTGAAKCGLCAAKRA